jgi:elongation factor Ts
MVTLDQIKELRSLTGVSTMACKSALEEASGDIQKAVELLRKKGAAKAAARADRSTGEGGVFVHQDASKAALVSLKCETDFVARSEDFVKYGQELADSEFAGNFDAQAARVSDVSSKVGEKLEVAEHITAEGKVVGTYIHSNRKIGVVVALDSGTEEMARDVAMHVAGLNPKYVTPEEVDTSLIDGEKGIWAEQLRQEGKSEDKIPMIIQGKEKKFRQEQALLTQAFVKNPEQTVGQYLGSAKIQKFSRLSI